MYIDHTQSTNSLVREQYLEEANGFCLYTFDQRAGRGQSGNSWQSEAGKNLLFTLLLQQPPVAPELAFTLNMAVSLGVWEAIAEFLGSERGKLTIKWPNDLYIGHRKVCGILIENLLSSTGIAHSIIGVGININQTEWSETIPNPTSMQLETGKVFDPEVILQHAQDAILRQVEKLTQPEQLKQDYMAHLYRREGYHLYVERPVDSSPTMISRGDAAAFEARIEGISPRGELILSRRDGSRNTYHFKQIKFIIP